MVDKEKILQLHSEGKTCQEIKDVVGYSLPTIRKCIKDAGFTTNSKITRLNKEILDKIEELLNIGKTNLQPGFNIFVNLPAVNLTPLSYSLICLSDARIINIKNTNIINKNSIITSFLILIFVV